MAGEGKPRGAELTGALIGWERRTSSHGVTVTMQIVENAKQYQDRRYHRVTMALNDRQLRSLARDLARAALSRGLDLRSRPSLPKRFLLWSKALVKRSAR
jgi:hypothetical protein